MGAHTYRRRGGRIDLKKSVPLVGAFALMVVLVAVVVGGRTVAAWKSESAVTLGEITAGDLKVTIHNPTWVQVTPGVPTDKRSSGMVDEGTEGFVSMPGDVIEIRVPIRTELTGHNLVATMSLTAGAGALQDVADGTIAAGYHVENSAGAQVAPASGLAPLGTDIAVPGLASSNAGSQQDWTVVLTVDVLGDYAWSSVQNPAANMRTWAVEDVSVKLDQVREGAGFTDGGRP